MTENRYARDLFDGVRPLIVAGIPVGVIVAGVGSRLAMLLLLGASIGVIGAAPLVARTLVVPALGAVAVVNDVAAIAELN